MLKLYFTEGFKNFKKNKIVTFLMIILFTSLFVLLGFISINILFKNARDSLTSNNDFTTYNFYNFGTPVSRRDRIGLYEDRLEHAKLSQEFFKNLDRIKNLKYVSLDDNSIRINNFKGSKIFLLGYENGISQLFSNNNNSIVKILKTNDGFIKHEKYKVIEGRNITEDDLIYKENDYTPVLLGYSYKGIYKSGDILEISTEPGNEDLIYGNGYYHSKLEVIGILEEDVSIINGNATQLMNLNRYIICPFQYLPVSEMKKEQWIINTSYTLDMLFMWTKLMINTEYENEVLVELQQTLDSFGNHSKYFKIFDRKLITSLLNNIEDTRFNFYIWVTLSVFIFSVIGLIITVLNKLKSNIKDYAIHILVGGRKKDIVLCAVSEVIMILLYSNILSFLPFAYLKYFSGRGYENIINPATILLILTVNIIIIFITIFFVYINIKKYKTSELIR